MTAQVPTSDGIASVSCDPSSNRITTAGFAYDEAGNLTHVARPGQVPQIYQYDVANRLVKTGSRIPDPQRAPGAFLYSAEGTFSPAINQTSVGTYEMLVHESTSTIWHFNFVSH